MDRRDTEIRVASSYRNGATLRDTQRKGEVAFALDFPARSEVLKSRATTQADASDSAGVDRPKRVYVACTKLAGADCLVLCQCSEAF